MALNSVTLTGTVPGGAGATAAFTPSAWLTDSTDNQLIPPVPKAVTLDGNGKFSVSLLATDNGALLPSGWTWSVVISGANMASLGFSFFLPFSGGATQDIADLTPVQPTPSMAAYMPLPGGTPTASEVPIATGTGEASVWGTPPGGAPSGAAGGDLGGTYPNPGVSKVTGVSYTVASTAPGSPATNDLWYDQGNDLLKQYNGSGWQLSGSATARGYRPPDIQVVDKIFMGQSGGFSPTFSGAGSTGNNTDTSDFVLGTYAVKGSTSGSSGQCNISGSFGVALNLTGKNPVVWVKMENYANFLGGYPRLFLGDAGLTNVYQWKLTNSAGQPWARDGEWMRITLPMGSATITGSPSRSSLAALTIQTFDNGSGPAVVHLGGLATMAEPVAWPNGVLSLCFDDGLISQFTTAKPYMDKYGYRATAYVITETLWNHGSFSGYYDIPTAQALESESGWEIAAHAYTSANHNASYTGIPDAAALADMQAAKAYLRAQGFRAPDHFAYPLGNFDSATVLNAQSVFGSGRTISQIGGFPDETFPPAQIGRLRSIAVSANSSIPTIEGYVTAAAANKEWLLLTMHDIVTSASGNVQLSTANFQALMDFTAASGIQVMPVSEVLRTGMTPQVDPVATDYTVVGSAVAAGATGKPADAGHTHAFPGPIPADFGYVAWSSDPGASAASAPLTAGTITLIAVFLRKTATISNIIAQVTALGNTLTSSENFAGLYDSTGTLRGVTADQTASWGSASVKTMALTTPYANAPPGMYYVALLSNGTTAPTFRTTASTIAIANAGLSGASLRYASNGSGTTLPGSLTLSSNAITNAQSVCVVLS
jgi:peptidoglycan/xylan/chitin deacetylase (PgdA/CDA1 family)